MDATERTSALDRDAALDLADDGLVHVRRLLQLPGYRRRLRSALPIEIETSTLRVLRAVERAGDDAPSIGDVAERVGVDPSSASRFVDQAVGLGLLERHTCDRDRRRSRLHLTGDGRRLLDAATRVRRQLLAEATVGWSDDDVAALGELLQRLRDGFDRFEPQP